MTQQFKYHLETAFYFTLVLLWYLWQYYHWNGDYLDTDNYFHALRLFEAFHNQEWAEHVFPYSNYPFGEVLHWTRAFDILWGILALPFLCFFDLRLSIFYSGILVAPVCLLGAIFYFLKAGRLLVNVYERLLIVILFFVQANVMRVAVLNRPDHHAVFLFLSAYILYKMLKFAQKKKIKDLVAAALMTSVALWMAAEGIFLFIATALFLFYGYRFLGYKYDYLLRYCVVYTLGCCFFLLINPPYQGYLFIDSGRLSLFHVLALFSICAILLLGRYCQRLIYQYLALCFGGIALIGAYYFAGWLNSPLDERIIKPFVARNLEMVHGNVYTLAYPFVGLVCGVYLAKKYFKDGCFVFLGINLLFFSVLTAFAMRFLPYSGVYAAFMMAFFVSKIAYKKLFALIFILLEYIAFALHIFTDNTVKTIPVLNIPTQTLAKLPSGTFATEIFYAPYLIYYGRHTVIASPYHRNVEGILDNHQIFFSSDEDEVVRLLKKHQVRYIYLSDGLDEAYYQAPLANCDKLYGKIFGCHNYPYWLKVIDDKNGNYLFEVVFDEQ